MFLAKSDSFSHVSRSYPPAATRRLAPILDGCTDLVGHGVALLRVAAVALRTGPRKIVGGGRAAGDGETLKAVVGEAATRSHFLSQHAVHLAPWVGAGGAAVPRSGSGADTLVPCAARVDEAAKGADASRKWARVVGEDGLSGSAAPGRRSDSALITLDGCGTGADDVCGFTTTTKSSPARRTILRGGKRRHPTRRHRAHHLFDLMPR
ncbi:transcription factor UNE10 isoform X2 [Panicum miliaceum]|uniref:Transcription factor UNE10 isoform X2 n=1 Tax=Panicum miliaceum TaxID=4540 RepID=A0A3L6Q1H5_PANMI|nr:transcription factor UNE10 isoform X2 [Panicum miliaceum]